MKNRELYERAIKLTEEIVAMNKQIEVIVRQLEGLPVDGVYKKSFEKIFDEKSFQPDGFWPNFIQSFGDQKLSGDERNEEMEQLFGAQGFSVQSLADEHGSATLQMVLAMNPPVNSLKTHFSQRLTQGIAESDLLVEGD